MTTTPAGVVLVAVTDSEAAFAAAAVAVAYAGALHARLRAVTVLPADAAERSRPESAVLRDEAADAALRHVAALAERAGVDATGTTRHGGVAAQILAEASACGAELVVMARVARPGHALPTVGSQTLRVLEFATVPVLVVPTQVHRPGWHVS
ncbi:universal stress protein [Isoptericola sp. b441]|uniref:Universal stress protein n=1 Tax=Actinotalea lenta TaxID=3064654 RepID=A0ABT9DCF0_9CELL|nr:MULTISPECIES: universal stress protein [unclassified Isoptericola]MDO8106976.1 universal stress protein [Isoptericola sp. b441]MDO8121314.1 universal stress protein [Isoptericola sp. b490]